MDKNVYKDKYEIHFDTKEDAEAFFTEQYLGDIWIEAKSTSMKVDNIDPLPVPLNWSNPSHAGKVIDELSIKSCSPDALMDSMTAEGTQIYADIGGYGRFLVRPTALDGLKFRAGQEGRVTETMFNKRRADYYPEQINRGLEVMDGDVKVLIRGEKITAMNSGHFVDLPVCELIAELSDVLERRFPGYAFTGAEYDHWGMSMSFILPNQGEELLKAYRETLDNAHVATGNAYTCTPAITFTTSDIGVCCATVRAQMIVSSYRTGNFVVEIGDAIKLAHKGNATPAAFRDLCEQLYAAYTDQAQKLSQLLDAEIKNVENCIKAVCQRMSFPVGVLRYATDNYLRMGEKDTAHDVFWTVCDAVSKYIAENELKGHARIRLEEGAARMLTIHPYEWKELELKVRSKVGKSEAKEVEDETV